MPINPKYLAHFEEGGIYHVYNRTNNRDALFLTDRHRAFFLKRFVDLLSPLVDTYAWSLLDNHFHFLIRIKSYGSIRNYYLARQQHNINLTLVEGRFIAEKIVLNDLMEFTFKRFFQSYALAFNKDMNGVGSIFVKKFKRLSVNQERHLMQTVIYIHANAVKHGIAKDFTTYPWSSWHSFTGRNEGFVTKDFIIDFFGGQKAFEESHLLNAPKYARYKSALEDI